VNNKQKGHIAVELMIVVFFIIAIIFGGGWINNIVNILHSKKVVNEWNTGDIVCAVGIPVVPVGAICGLSNHKWN
jgi:hypothetical protein